MSETTEREATQQIPGLGDPTRLPGEPALLPEPLGRGIEDRTLEMQQADVYRTEVQIVSHRAMMLEAKAREMQAYFKLAKAFAKTSMVRKEYQWDGDEDDMKPVHNLCAAMMYGAKLGIEPEDAGLLIITINDTPALEGKTMVGIVRRWCDTRVAAGRTKTFEEGGDGIWEVTADDEHAIWAARRDGHEVSCEWTMARAINADVTSDDHKMKTRQGNWIKDMYGKFPVEMLRARAQTEVARIQFSDVLRGMQYSAEELRLVERTVNVPIPTVQGGTGAAALERVLEQNHGDHMATFHGDLRQGDVVDSEQTTEETHVVAGGPGSEPATEDVAQDHDPEQVPDYLVKLRQTLHILLTSDAKVTDRNKKLKVLGNMVGRELSTSKELDDDELANTIGLLQTWKRGRVLGQNVVAILKGEPLVEVELPPEQAPAERASMDQLKSLRALYRQHNLQGKDMLAHMTDTLGWNVANINDLTDVDVQDCTRKLSAAK